MSVLVGPVVISTATAHNLSFTQGMNPYIAADISNESVVPVLLAMGGNSYVMPPQSTVRYPLNGSEYVITATPLNAPNPAGTIFAVLYTPTDLLPEQVARGSNFLGGSVGLPIDPLTVENIDSVVLGLQVAGDLADRWQLLGNGRMRGVIFDSTLTNRINDRSSIVLGSSGQYGGGNGTVSGQIYGSMPPVWMSGITLAGSTPVKAIVPGDASKLIGYYYVATSVSNNPSVPIIAAVFDGTNTVLTISFITGHTAGQNFEISTWPGGSSGHVGTNGVLRIYKPASARSAIQVGSNSMLYQYDGGTSAATLILLGLDGVGPNGDYLRDIVVADIGMDSCEIAGTVNDFSPGGTDGPKRAGILLYRESGFYAYRGDNNPRDKSFSLDGVTGDVTLWAIAATTPGETNTSPTFNLLGTYWDAGLGVSVDRNGYIETRVLNSTGDSELAFGFSYLANPTLSLDDSPVGSLKPTVDLGARVGTVSNRMQEILAGPLGFRVVKTVGDAQPIAALVDTGLSLGSGGGGAPDVTFGRGAAGIAEITGAALVAGPVGAVAGFLKFYVNGTEYRIQVNLP